MTKVYIERTDTRNVSKYVLERRENPKLRTEWDWERLSLAEEKRKRKARGLKKKDLKND